ncbi:hypothetical protein ACQYRI_09190 [Salmonella enterica]
MMRSGIDHKGVFDILNLAEQKSVFEWPKVWKMTLAGLDMVE